jgi:outer membrane protein OmpA-like peptidoglycan-associated protein
MILPLVLAGAAAIAASPCLPPPTHDEVAEIFFEPGSADLSGKALEVLQFSRTVAVEEKYLRETVTGFCDADENAAGACPALARRRAEAAKAALVKLGLKAKRIETFTKTELLDPSEPRLNRRAVIAPVLPPDDMTCPGQ